jgi:hypothetical protein
VTNPLIEMQNDFERQHIIHRERGLEAFSLDLALLSKIIVHNSNVKFHASRVSLFARSLGLLNPYIFSKNDQFSHISSFLEREAGITTRKVSPLSSPDLSYPSLNLRHPSLAS